MNQKAIIRQIRHGRAYFIKLPQPQLLPLSAIDRPSNVPTVFSAATVHEVRNPLTNIRLACELLDSNKLDEDQRSCLHIILRGADRINAIINTLLKPEENLFLQYELYSLKRLVEDVLLLVKDRLLLKNIQVFTEYEEAQPAVSIDIEKMKLALINIVNNAIEAMPSETGKLNMITRSNGQISSLEIQDNGKGISKKNLKKIFKPYFTDKSCGLGLGLPAMLNIIKANHAEVEVKSIEGKGTSFIVSFATGTDQISSK